MASRPTIWGDHLFKDVIASGGQMTVRDLRPSITDTDRFTIIRILVNLCVLASSTPTNQEGAQRIDFGIGVTSAEAFNAGVLPEADIEGEFPRLGWLVRESMVYMRAKTSTDEGVQHVPVSKLDLRASRKIDRGIPFMVATNTDIETAAISVRLCGLVRVLFLQ